MNSGNHDIKQTGHMGAHLEDTTLDEGDLEILEEEQAEKVTVYTNKQGIIDDTQKKFARDDLAEQYHSASHQ